MDDRWFVFAAGIGFDGAIVGGVEAQRRKGRKSTHLLYARVGLAEFVRTDRRHPKLHSPHENSAALMRPPSASGGVR